MLRAIPRPALGLGLAGLAPFLAGAGDALGLGRAPPDLLAVYGAIILAFMGGCLWGFAAQGGRAGDWVVMAASVAPALWAVLAFIAAGATLILLAVGFALLLGLDLLFARAGLAPSWWTPYRIALSAVVIACLSLGAAA